MTEPLYGLNRDPGPIPEHLYPNGAAGAPEELKAAQAAMAKAKEVGEAAQKEAAALPQMTVASVLGEIVWLMSQSPGHKHFAISDLEWMVMPPIMLQQYRIFRNDNKMPIGVALWAYLSEDAEKKLEAGQTRLRPDEWNATGKLKAMMAGEEEASGGDSEGDDTRLWLVDLIAPFGHQEEMLIDMKDNVFRGQGFKFHNVKDGKREIVAISERAE